MVVLAAHWPFAIFHTSVSPVAGLNQNTSPVPSGLKSPVNAAGIREGARPIRLPAHWPFPTFHRSTLRFAALNQSTSLAVAVEVAGRDGDPPCGMRADVGAGDPTRLGSRRHSYDAHRVCANIAIVEGARFEIVRAGRGRR